MLYSALGSGGLAKYHAALELVRFLTARPGCLTDEPPRQQADPPDNGLDNPPDKETPVPSVAAEPLVPVGGITCHPTPDPPARWFRLYDGRTLGWGGLAWAGRWVCGDAVFPATTPAGWDRGEPTDADGKKLTGGFVKFHPKPFSEPSPRTPTPVQGAMLDEMPLREGEVEGLNGNRQRTALSLDTAGWVYWSGSPGFATLHLTEAGESALKRFKAARERRRERWRTGRRPAGS